MSGRQGALVRCGQKEAGNSPPGEEHEAPKRLSMPGELAADNEAQCNHVLEQQIRPWDMVKLTIAAQSETEFPATGQ